MARKRAGTLTGHAAGETQQVVNVADDVRAVFGEDGKVWSAVLVERLAELRPETYGEWTTETLAAALRPHKVTPRDVWGRDETGQGVTRRGYTRTDLG
jgi:S-DNA-T family DNA segregation ATPase FtsK/SpoIIIE